MLKAVILAASLAVGSPSAQTDAPVKFDRHATVKDAKGVVIQDLGEHTGNPFPSREACVEGLEQDTANIYRWLMGMGVDISELDVDVTCRPTGHTI